MKKILFVTNDIIGDRTAGPGIRYVELGKILARKGYTVTLLGKKPAFSAPQPFYYAALNPRSLFKSIKRSDCIIVRGGGPITTFILSLFSHSKDITSDLYAFTHLEVAHIAAKSFLEHYIVELRKAFHSTKLKIHCKYFRKFWVANNRQRDFLHGVLYLTDSIEHKKNITVIPFGYPSDKPVKGTSVLRGVMPGIEHNDFLLIWGGGVWDWLDPITLIKAMSNIWEVNRGIKLYFMGIKAPSGYTPEKARELIEVSRELGILNRNVFINNEWTPYDRRTDYLLEADVGVSLHPASLETNFSFRTRNLDYIHCGLPMIHTDGDVWAEIIQRKGLGIVVPPRDNTGVSKAIIRLYGDKALMHSMRENIQNMYNEFTWENIAERAIRSIEKEGCNNKNVLFGLVSIFKDYLVFGIKSFFIFLKAVQKRF